MAAGLFLAIVLLFSVGLAGRAGVFLNAGGGDAWGELRFRKVIGTAEAMHLTFPAPMDHASVESRLAWPKGVSGTIEWRGNRLSLIPSDPLEYAEDHLVTVGGGALREDGSSLEKDLRYLFTTEDPPAATFVAPGDASTGVKPFQRITVMFDRPMIPMDALLGKPPANSPFPVLSPPATGEWTWMTSSTAVFAPSTGFALATAYTLKLPKGTTTLSGDVFPEDRQWSFETERPQLVSTSPSSLEKYVPPESPMVLHFNQAMNDESVMSHVRLLELAAGGTPRTIPLALGKRREETTMELVPQQALALHRTYRLELDAGTLPKTGALGTASSVQTEFFTVGDFSVVSGDARAGYFSVQFSSPVNFDAAKSLIVLERDGKPVRFTMSKGTGRYLSVQYDPQPEMTYDFTVSDKVQDAFGRALGSTHTAEFAVPAPEPLLQVDDDEEFTVLTGQKPRLDVMARNIFSLDATVSALDPDDFLWWIGRSKFLGEREENRASVVRAYLASHAAKHRAFSVPTTEKKNEHPRQSIIDLPGVQEGQPLRKGLYLYTFSSPRIVRWKTTDPVLFSRVFNVTDLSIVVRSSGEGFLSWVTDRRTGAPVHNAKIILLDEKMSKSTAMGSTDAQGLAAVSIPDTDHAGSYATTRSLWLAAVTNDDLALVPVTGWDEPKKTSMPVTIVTRTDRPLYRPGETVYVSGFVRTRNNPQDLAVFAGENIEVTLNDSGTSRTAQKKTLTTDAFGAFHGEFLLPSDAALGSYEVVARPGSAAFAVTAPSVYVQVLEFEKPEFRVNADFPADMRGADGDAHAAVDAAYLFDAPLAGAPVSWRLTARPAVIPFRKGFVFGDTRRSAPPRDSSDACMLYDDCNIDEVVTGTARLDEAGHADLRMPLQSMPTESALSLYLSATVRTPADANSLTTEAHTIVYPYHEYVGIHAGVGREEGSLVVSLFTQSPKGQALAGRRVRVRVEGVSARQRVGSGSQALDVERETDAWGEANIAFSGLPRGRVVVIAEVTDKAGVTHRSAQVVSIGTVQEPQKDTTLVLSADKGTYAVGETARFLVRSPSVPPNTLLLVTVEQNGSIREHRFVAVRGSGTVIEVPVTEELRPNSAVTATLALGAGAIAGGEARVLTATSPLLVSQNDRILDIRLSPSSAFLRPRDVLTVMIATTNQGVPVAASVSLAIIDRAILELAASPLPDLVEAFYPAWKKTSSSFLSLSHVLRPPVIRTYEENGAEKGGGGDDSLAAIVRENMKSTAYWNGSIQTDAAGKTSVDVALPDNTTTWMLRAMGATKDSRFGTAESSVVSSLPLIVRPIAPRFGIWGDRVALRAAIHNRLPVPQTVTVVLSGKGFSPRASTTTTLSLDAESSAMVDVPVTFTEHTSLSYTWHAKSQDAEDAVSAVFPLYPFASIETVASLGKTEDDIEEQFATSPIPAYTVDRATVRLVPSLSGFLEEGSAFLSQYPYGCTEQLLSSVLPYAIAARVGLADATQSREAKERMAKVVEQLKKHQLANGGFGFWDNPQYAYSPLTSYALRGLTAIREHGVPVPRDMTDRAAEFLRRFATDAVEKEIRVSPNEKAEILYALSLAGKPENGVARALFANRTSLTTEAKAFLALSFGSRTSEAQQLVNDLRSSLVFDGRSVSVDEESFEGGFSFTTTQRTEAVVTQVLLRGIPDEPLTTGLLQHLLLGRRDGHWDTTQSTIQALLALEEALIGEKASGVAAKVSATINGKDLGTFEPKGSPLGQKKTIDVPMSLLDDDTPNRVVIAATGGASYYDVVLRYRHAGETLPPVDRGLGITRKFTTLSGSAATLVFGNTYRMTVVVTVPRRREFVAIEAPIPAGMELIDTALRNASEEALQEERESREDAWYGEYDPGRNAITRRELRDDTLFLFADVLHPGVYEFDALVHASLPGTFHWVPAKASEMYFPEVFGATEGRTVVIK